jgi:hypothetical protein
MNAMHNRKLTIADLRSKAVPPEPPPAARKATMPPPPAPRQSYRDKLTKRFAPHGLPATAVDAVTMELIDRYPMLFDVRQRRALAIGIHKHILADLNCHPVALSEALRRWCSHPGYLRRMAGEGSHRHHLDGTRAAELTAEEKAKAAHTLAALREREQQRKAAIASCQPERAH